MTGRCIEKLPHKCGSSNGLQVFDDEGKYSAYCFSCETYEEAPYQDKPEGYKPEVREKTKEEVQEGLTDIQEYPTCDLPSRKLTKENLEHFSVTVSVSEIDGQTPQVRYFPYYGADGTLQAYKAKLIDQKRMWCVGSMKDVNLFGWQQALESGAKTLFITEGEDDAVALYQALKDNSKGGKWAHLEPAVVSLTRGASGVKKDLVPIAREISSNFKEVVLVFDQDEAGQEAVRAAMDVLPSARICGTLPAKDANECIQKGYNKGLVSAVLYKADKPKNTRLVDLADFFPAGRVQAEMGLSWPWEGMTKLTKGLRWGETYYLGAGVKMGKSDIVNTLAAHFLLEHKLNVCLVKPEEALSHTAKVVLGKVAGRVFHDPDIPIDFEAYDQAAGEIGHGRIYAVDVYQHLSWESLRNEIVVAKDLGCRVVFIDPITNLSTGYSSGETNTLLQEIAQALAALAKDLDIMVFIFCHLKAPETGPAHERGGKVFSNQFSGSRAMMRSCNLMVGLEGNKDPDLPVEDRNMRRLIILEDRAYGSTGFIHLYFDVMTGMYNEVKL